ncbi:uncharacterized protein TNCV_1164801 [Trichonephila clavipes]|nr:uncharacterized protein TNCV_1164801 [Trichonephila clavipes]
MVSWEYFWPTLHCRREAGVSPRLSIGWWYLSSESPKRHCCRVSAADKGCRVYPLDPRPDAVVLYSGCTPGKRRAWHLPDDRHTASLVRLRGGWRHARTKLCCTLMDPMLLCPGKGLVLPKTHIDKSATHIRFLFLSLPNNAMSQKSLFAIQKALIAIGGEPKSVKRLRSGDLLIETISALQTKFFLLAKTFLDSPVFVSPHKSLNTCHGVISELDLLTIPDVEILEGFSGQTVIQTDENITKIKCPPLKLLQQPSSFPHTKPNISPSIPSTSASSAQADLLTSTSPIADISESKPVNPIPNNVPSKSNISAFPSNSGVQPTSASTFIQDSKQKAKTRARKREKKGRLRK